MKLHTKLLTAIGIVLILVFAAVEYNSYKDAEENAILSLQDQAEKVRSLLMTYRNNQQQVFLKYNLPMNEINLHFLPAFVIGKLSQEYPTWDKSGFSFENISDQPRNPEHLADEIELQAMNYFRQHPTEQKLFQPFKNIKKNNEEYYLYARPIWVEQHCLKCHGNPEEAPQLIREQYNTAWNYKLGELRGILSIKLPADTVKARAWDTFKKGAIIHLIGFIGIFLSVLVIIKRNVTMPLEQLSQGLQSVTKGNYTHQLSGFQGEFALISDSFNEMTESISEHREALNNLNNQLEQRAILRTTELAEANAKIMRLNEKLEIENSQMSNELEITRKLQQLAPNDTHLETICKLDIAGFEPPDDAHLTHKHSTFMLQLAVKTLLVTGIVNPEHFTNIQHINISKNIRLALLDYHDGKLYIVGQYPKVFVVRKNGYIEQIQMVNLDIEPNQGFHFLKQIEIDLHLKEGIILCDQEEAYPLERFYQMIDNLWTNFSSYEIRYLILDDIRSYVDKREINFIVVKRIA